MLKQIILGSEKYFQFLNWKRKRVSILNFFGRTVCQKSIEPRKIFHKPDAFYFDIY
jgi:hypothetical protein